MDVLGTKKTLRWLIASILPHGSAVVYGNRSDFDDNS